jgi:hypothetical protein
MTVLQRHVVQTDEDLSPCCVVQLLESPNHNRKGTI